VQRPRHLEVHFTRGVGSRFSDTWELVPTPKALDIIDQTGSVVDGHVIASCRLAGIRH